MKIDPQIILALTNAFISYVWQHRIFYLMMLALLGFICYIAGEIVNKVALDKIVQGQTVNFPYKPLYLSLCIGGVVIMIIAAILLYFAGGYDPFFQKMGWM